MSMVPGSLTLTVIIPVYHPGKQFLQLAKALTEQTVRPERILLIHTLSDRGPEQRRKDEQILNRGKQILGTAGRMDIDKKEFDHGGTRDRAARSADTDLVLFMTMDAVPADPYLIANLKDCFADPRVACAYARQLPAQNAGAIERYTRSFNYPEQSRVKSRDDLDALGIKTFFCSDVCAAYRRDRYLQLGGFVHPVIFNEDMIFAGTAVMAGYCVYYRADAKVIHSHNYSGLQQFHRNFDLGVSQADHPEIFSAAKSEKEGIRMIGQTAEHLFRTGKGYLLPKLIWQSGWKFIGYRMGKAYRHLPGRIVQSCTMNRTYWQIIENDGKQTTEDKATGKRK